LSRNTQATSREGLGVAGERTVQLAPLPLGADAEALFHDRTSVANPRYL